MLTTKDLLKKLGLDSPRTLKRWEEDGLIPTPALGKHPNGRGMTYLYPKSTLDLCRRIIRYQKLGRSMKEIKYLLHIPEAEAAFNVAKGQKADPQEAFYRLIFGYVREAIPNEEERAEFIAALRREKVFEATEKMVLNGDNPVLIYRPRKLFVTPDFTLSQIFFTGMHESECQPAKIVPLAPPYFGMIDALDRERPAPPTKTPARRVNVAMPDLEMWEMGFIYMEKGRYSLQTHERAVRMGGASADLLKAVQEAADGADTPEEP